MTINIGIKPRLRGSNGGGGGGEGGADQFIFIDDHVDTHTNILGPKTVEAKISAARTVRTDATITSNTAKIYFEVHLDVASDSLKCIGILDKDHSLGGFIGNDTDDIGVGLVFGAGLTRYYNCYVQTDVEPYTPYAAEDGYVMMAVDFATGKCWWGYNGSWIDSGDPAAGTGYQEIATEIINHPMAIGVQPYAAGVPRKQMTLRTKGSEFEGTVPSGFSGPDD